MARQKNKAKAEKKSNPFKNLVLDEYEQGIEASLAKEEWKPVENAEEIKAMFKDAARRHRILNQSKKVTLRVNQGDLIKLKAKAKRTNISYQTLLNALIRDFVEGNYSVKL